MHIHFIITMSQAELTKAEEQGFDEYFKLAYKFRIANMMCFDFNGKIKKYDSPEHVLEEFYPRRLAFYQKRKVCFYFAALNSFLSPDV
jgi:DNA topoisomerase-2